MPVTTDSEPARLAYLAGRNLQERLRAADARVEFNQLNVNYGFVRRAALTMCEG